MARPADPRRREQTLKVITDYVLEHGLIGLSLRPLASALGTSTRMLLYDFSSKEQLIMAALSEARRRESAMLASHLTSHRESRADVIHAIWDWLSASERAPFLRLFFEVYVQSMNHPSALLAGGNAMITDWLDQFGKLLTDFPADDYQAMDTTLFIAVIRGLILDRLMTEDRVRTDAAMKSFLQLLNSSMPHLSDASDFHREIVP